MSNLQINMLCRRIAHCKLEDSMAVVQGIKRLVMKLVTRRQHTGARRGRRRLFEHMGDQGEQVETRWESGKTIRHLTWEEGQVT